MLPSCGVRTAEPLCTTSPACVGTVGSWKWGTERPEKKTGNKRDPKRLSKLRCQH